MRPPGIPILLAATAVASQDLPYGQHIFNAIHSSMRQWGSSLNHNGMSAFIATVPAGTEFYHGTSSPYRVNGTEWLAFEPEHALIFARAHKGGPPGRGGKPPGPPPPDMDEEETVTCEGSRGRRDPPGEHDQSRHGPMNDEALPRKHLDFEGRSAKHHEPPRDGAPAGKHHDFGDEPREHHGPRGNEGLPRKEKSPVSGLPHARDSPRGRRGPKNDFEDCHNDPSGPQHDPAPPDEPQSPHDSLDEPRKDLRRNVNQGIGPQEPLKEADEPVDTHGYLHTYTTKHPLRLLYLDGQSAAKSRKGTLDTQDVVILQLDPTALENQDDQPHHGPMGEYERASGLCKMAHEHWNDNIDGILRMEGGFEIILCSFARDLDVKSIIQTKPDERKRGPGGPPGAGMNYYRAVAARYDGIGGDRVTVDYDDFVTLFERLQTMYFDDTGRPRARNVSKELGEVRADIGRMARERKDGQQATNWQAVVDMVIARYADRIEYLATGKFETLEAFEAEVDNALKPFVDYSARNATLEVSRCATQFLPAKSNHSSLAARSILHVTIEICSTLTATSSLVLAASPSLADSQHQLREIQTWLGWTTWRKCRGCKVDEVCFLPIWPQGSAEDFEHPQCRSDLSETHGGYWGGFGGPAGQRGGERMGKSGKQVQEQGRNEGERVRDSPRPH